MTNQIQDHAEAYDLGYSDAVAYADVDDAIIIEQAEQAAIEAEIAEAEKAKWEAAYEKGYEAGRADVAAARK
jgi:hypothetical protein